MHFIFLLINVFCLADKAKFNTTKGVHVNQRVNCFGLTNKIIHIYYTYLWCTIMHVAQPTALCCWQNMSTGLCPCCGHFSVGTTGNFTLDPGWNRPLSSILWDDNAG